MKLCTHHHHGWMEHSAGLGLNDDAALHLVLLQTHSFLQEFEGKYTVTITRTPEYSYDGIVYVNWDSDDECPASTSWYKIDRGQVWFKAFEFNFADDFACTYCGGTGMDHYSGPFCLCWACDGTKKAIRSKTWNGFMKKPSIHSPAASHAKYAAWKAANP